MADVSFTAIRPTSDTQTRKVQYGATVAAGNTLYFDTTDQEWKLGDCDAEDTAKTQCIALTPGVDGGYGIAAFGGTVELVGATMTAGDSYSQSGTAGAIMPETDFASSDYITGIGRAVSATSIKLSFDPTGAQVA